MNGADMLRLHEAEKQLAEALKQRDAAISECLVARAQRDEARRLVTHVEDRLAEGEEPDDAIIARAVTRWRAEGWKA